LRYRFAQQYASSTRERRAGRFAPYVHVPRLRGREYRRYPGPRYWFISGGLMRQLP
jgi:hypothetical protein